MEKEIAVNTFSKNLHQDYIDHFNNAAYVVLRPMRIVNEDDSVTTSIAEAETYEIMVGPSGGPPNPIAFHSALEDAVTDLMAIKCERPELRLWYDSNEIQIEMFDDPWPALAEAVGEDDEDWGIVHRVCTGEIPLSDVDAAYLIEEGGVHAIAIASVFQRLALASVPPPEG